MIVTFKSKHLATLIVIAFGGMLVGNASASAQADSAPFEVIETDEKLQGERIQRSAKNAVRAIFRSATPILSNKKNKDRVDIYYEKILFAGWTQPDKLEKIVAERQEFFKIDYKYATKLPANFAYLNDLTVQSMIKIAGGHYHPAARHNAMLVLGRLKATGSTDAKPLAKALNSDGGLISSAISKNQHPVVRVAAVVGLAEHAKAGVAPAAKGQMVNALLDLLRERQPVGEMSDDGNTWLRIRAAEAASYLGDVGPKGAMVVELITIAGDAKENLSLRCAAARASEPLLQQAAGGASLNPKEIAGTVGNLVVDILNEAAAANIPNARRLYHQTESAAICISKLTGSAEDRPAIDGIKKEVVATAAVFSQNVADANAIKDAKENVKKALEMHKLLRASDTSADESTTETTAN